MFAGVTCPGQSRIKMHYEAGATYFSNFAVDSARHLTDFITLTFNPRIILLRTENSGLAVEAPVSLRTKQNEHSTVHFAVHLPLLVTYSTGAGAGGYSEEALNKKLGITAGLGWGYFFQRTESAKGAYSRFNEKLETSGPEIQFGFLTPLKRKLYLFDRDNPLDVVLAIKGNYLINTQKRNYNIGALSVLLDFHF